MEERMLPCKMCEMELITEGVYLEELGMCRDCSDLYWSHNHEDCSWLCMVEFPIRAKEAKEKVRGGVA